MSGPSRLFIVAICVAILGVCAGGFGGVWLGAALGGAIGLFSNPLYRWIIAPDVHVYGNVIINTDTPTTPTS
jgi:hypothetical protein